MASEELARKLQRRLDAEQAATAEPAPAPADPTPAEVPPPPPAKGTETPPETERAAAASDNTNTNPNPASSELDAKLTRRLDINDGIAPTKRSKVFNPYTEFKEFSRKQIKEMEAMFKRQAATQHNTTQHNTASSDGGVNVNVMLYGDVISRVSSSQGPQQYAAVLFVWSSVGLGLHCDTDR